MVVSGLRWKELVEGEEGVGFQGVEGEEVEEVGDGMKVFFSWSDVWSLVVLVFERIWEGRFYCLVWERDIFEVGFYGVLFLLMNPLVVYVNYFYG